MINVTMNPHAVLEKTTDPDFLREMIGFTAQRLMVLEVETPTGTKPGARTPGQLNQRTGYRTVTGRPGQANRVNISSREETGEELIVPPRDLSSEAE
jgi:hypothetical protein